MTARSRRVIYPRVMSDNQVSRRAVLAGAAALLATPAAARTKLKISIFSKHLHHVQGAELAKTAAELGFDGVDITVRKGGHVLPEQVKETLPPLVKTLRAQGLEVPMITTEIGDAETPHAEDVLRTASELGIRNYRFGTFRYAPDKPLPAQLEAFKPRLEKLAKLNAKYQTTAMYHTHSGVGLVGAPIWDLHLLMKDIDPKLVGINYDVGHAHIEGGLGGWIASWRVAGAHVRGIALKDYVWAKDERGRWRENWIPIGEGMVHWDEFLKMVAASDFAGPVQVHMEYPLPKDNAGIYAAYKKDLAALRGYFAKAGL
jgi:sugar phosphate isomerase/epimerase